MSGGTPFDRIVAAEKRAEKLRPTVPKPTAGVDSLSARELQVLNMLSAGYTRKTIALRLSLTHSTVRTHTANATKKIGARTACHAVALLVADRYA